jgi:hypothetical protein
MHTSFRAKSFSFERDTWHLLGRFSFETEHHLSARFGLEQFENGKRTDFQYQIWDVTCFDPSRLPGITGVYCSVQRIILTKWDDENLKTGISEQRHDTEEQTMVIKDLDWTDGRLDFTLIHSDGSRTEALMRFENVRDSFYLKTFNAIAVGKGLFSDQLYSVELKIPQFSYTVNFPVVIRGFRSESDRELNEILTSLNEADQKTWLKVRDAGSELFGQMEGLEKLIPDHKDLDSGKREMTKADWQIMVTFTVGEIRKNLRSIGMSVAGVEKLSLYFENEMRKKTPKDLK